MLPIHILFSPEVVEYPDELPINVLEYPTVRLYPAELPIAIFILPVKISDASIL